MNRRIFELFPLLLILISGTLSAQSIDQQEFREIFDPYLGIWSGEYRIFSQQDELLNSFKVERKYWWEQSIMMEQVTYDFGDMQQTYFNRLVLSDGMPFSFVTDSPDSDKIRSALRGSSLKGTTIWTRVLPKGSLPVRISERIVKKGEERFIDFWGDQEAINNKGESMFVRIEGYLIFQSGSRDYQPYPEKAEAPEPEIISDEPEDMEPIEEEEPVVQMEPVISEHQPEPREEEAVPESVDQKPEEIPEEVEKQEPQKEAEAPEPVVEEELPLPPPPPMPSPAIRSALENMNVVGIRDKKGDECIVVDYMLLYRLGDRLDMAERCYFTGIDDTQLYFKDGNGIEYQIPRKDKE